MRKKIIAACVLGLTLAVQATSQDIIELYEQGHLPAWSFPNEESQEVTAEGIALITRVTVPGLTYFKPAGAPAKAPAIIICPGGGYGKLAIGHEGYDVARELASWGIAAFVLKYRLPDANRMPQQHLIPLQDAQQALHLVRQRAAEWHIDANRVGILGFSAGGHLAASAGTHYQDAVALPAGTLLRPDLMMLIYPVISFQDGLVHPGSRQSLLGRLQGDLWNTYFSNELQVTAQTPPSFLVHAADDEVVPIGNSLAMAAALQQHGVPYQLIRYEKGGHGFGMINPTSDRRWMNDLQTWLRQQQWLATSGDK